MKRRATCSKGHRLSGKNLYVTLNRGYEHRACRKCSKARAKKYQRENAERVSAYEKKRAKTTKRRFQQANARWKFHGLKDFSTKSWFTIEDYDRMYFEQKCRCAVCGKHSHPRVLVPDHCHKTGFVRGLVHDNCNVLVGFANKDPALLRKAASYLERKSFSA